MQHCPLQCAPQARLPASRINQQPAATNTSGSSSMQASCHTGRGWNRPLSTRPARQAAKSARMALSLWVAAWPGLLLAGPAVKSGATAGPSGLELVKLCCRGHSLCGGVGGGVSAAPSLAGAMSWQQQHRDTCNGRVTHMMQPSVGQSLQSMSLHTRAVITYKPTARICPGWMLAARLAARHRRQANSMQAGSPELQSEIPG